MAPNPITFGDIESWARLTGRNPNHWEIDVLRQMDRAALEQMAKKSEQKGPVRREIDPDDWKALDRALGGLG